MEAHELSNLENPDTGKVSVLSQPPDLGFDTPHAATPLTDAQLRSRHR
jgi:hypothetical protein